MKKYKPLQYCLLLGLLLTLFIGNLSNVKAITFEGFLTYLGNQEKSEQITNWYNFINNAYYNSTIDFSSWLNAWDNSADFIYVYDTSISQNVAVSPQITFANLKDNNLKMYMGSNNTRVYLTGSLSYYYKTFNLNTSRGTASVSGGSNNYRNDIYVSNTFTTHNAFIIKEDILYSDSSLTSPYTGFYYFNNNYSDMGFKYVDSPIKTTYSNQYIKLGEFIGDIDYTNVAIQFGFLTENNTMGQVLATYGYPDSPELNKLKITNNVLYIPSRLITSDSYAVSVVIGTTSYDKVLDIEFVSASGSSGDNSFNIQDSTNNIIDNDNDNNDFWKETYNNLFTIDSGDTKDLINGFINSTNLGISGDEETIKIITDKLQGQADDFIISWNDIVIPNLFGNQQMVLIPQNEINFSQMCRENQGLRLAKGALNVITSGGLIILVLMNFSQTIMKLLGTENRFIDPEEIYYETQAVINDDQLDTTHMPVPYASTPYFRERYYKWYFGGGK